ncbi:hypothetical protein BDM02DRAFT_3092847, partial [Thelephora ganbajun]
LKQKTQELSDTAKDSARHKLQQGQDRVDEYRRTRQEAKDDAKARVTQTQNDVRSTVSEYGHDAQRKFDEYKTSASNALVDARDNTEKKFEEAKAAGSSWFSWGSSKADDARKEGAEDAKQKVDKDL